MTPGAPTYLLDEGAFQPATGLPLTDRGFRYGMSVFETIAIRDGAPMLLDAHLARLNEAASIFRPPAHWREASRNLLTQPPISEGVARIYVTAGDDDRAASRVAALFEELPIPTNLVTCAATSVEFVPALPFGKTGNYWPHFLARPADGSDAILCKPDGTVLGGSMSNLFLVLDGALVTPRAPIRRGVVRDWLLREGALPADLTRADLARATSAFLTNSRMGICALTSIDERPLTIDPMIDELWQRYRAEVLRAG